MSDDNRTILVLGATGQQGGSVARALIRANWQVRALVRDPTAAKALALRDIGVELVAGSLTDTDVIRAAMRNAHGVFSVLPGNLAQGEEVRLGKLIADLAVENCVAHLLYSSGASAGDQLTGVERFDAKPMIEAHIRSLPIIATIIRPVIFMEMLPRRGFGLDEGRYSFFLEPEQSMQLISVSDIGKFAAAIFNDPKRFGGERMTIASDTITGRDLEASFSAAAGYPIAYSRFSSAFLAANTDLGHMAASLIDGPLSKQADLNLMRNINPEISAFRSWLAGDGREAFLAALTRV